MLELAKEIIELTGSTSKIVFKELPEDDPKVRQPDITRATNILNWKPIVARRDGLKITIEDFKNRIKL